MPQNGAETGRMQELLARIGGGLALRPCFLGRHTQSDQVQGLLQAVLRIGKALVDEQ